MEQTQELIKRTAVKYDGLTVEQFYAKVKSLCKDLVITEEDLNSEFCTCWIEAYPERPFEATIVVALTEAISCLICKAMGYNYEWNDYEVWYFQNDNYEICCARLFQDHYTSKTDYEYLSKICYELIDESKCWGLTENWKAIDLSINDNFYLLPRK